VNAIFISVRTGSTRLPQKALKIIRDKTTIEVLIDRLKESQRAEKIILCTTELPEDDVLCEIATKNNIEFFRGSAPDKLKRWLGAAKQYGVEFFVNVDGDDIFFDAGLADVCFKQYDGDVDFIDGRGLYNDVYGINSRALQLVCEHKSNDDTEFIKLYFESISHLINIQKIKKPPEIYNKKNIRMTLDYEEDFLFFKTIVEDFVDNDKEMIFEDILRFLEQNPEVININWHREQSWIDNQDKMINKIKNEGE
jgi:spore coat polysaccharide biosynthesis protein SpsF